MYAVDPECDIAVATMAQLLLQQGKVTEALQYFERAAELSRTEGEIVNALSYAEATRTQLEVCISPRTIQRFTLANGYVVYRLPRSTHSSRSTCGLWAAWVGRCGKTRHDKITEPAEKRRGGRRMEVYTYCNQMQSFGR